jgi:hypothetical protein
MGPAISREEIREKRWSRELPKVFSCAKIADPFMLLPKFIHPLFPAPDKVVYLLCNAEGDLQALSHDTLSVIESFSARLPAGPLALAPLTPQSLILTSQATVFVVSAQETAFSIVYIDIPGVVFTHALPGGAAFVAVTRDSAAFLCGPDGAAAQVWASPGARALSGAIVPRERPILVISAADGCFIGFAEKDSEPRRIDGVAAFWKITPEAGGVVGISESRAEIVRVMIDNDFKIQGTKVLCSESELSDIAVLSDQTVVACAKGVIMAAPPDAEVACCLIAKTAFAAEVDDCQSLLHFEGQNVFVVVCRNAHLLICRASEIGKKDPFLQKKLHFVDIVACCNGDEFSFVTCDGGGNAILWENVPDWWDAPYHLKLFQDPSDA